LVLPTGSVTQRSDAGSPPKLTIDPRWRELDFGAWDGQHPRDLDPEALARFWADPDAAPPPGGERWSALVARVGAAIPVLADGTLVVTHAGAIRAALAMLCGFDARQVWAVALPYAAVVTLHIWPGEPPTAQIVRLA
jgi:alpha-ribazole phosphatase